VKEADMAESEADARASGTIVIGGDVEVHRLGFGAMRVTGEGIWGDPPDRDRAKAVLRRVVELGVDLIDTADSYGPEVSEELIADALSPYPDHLQIATKAGLERPGPFKWTPNGRPEHIRTACDGSLGRLRLEQIPLYQFHRPDPDVPYEESIGAMVELQQEGKVRHIGVSNVDVDQLRRARSVATIVSVQNRFNLGDRSSDDVLDACEADGLAFLPWAPIQDHDRDQTLSEIAARHGADARQVVLAWLLARSPVMVPIPGTGSVSHLEANVAAVDIELTPDEVASLSGTA
jgi:aryl-alcohol dehydrogenase-like predicted oxidoreductase